MAEKTLEKKNPAWFKILRIQLYKIEA